MGCRARRGRTDPRGDRDSRSWVHRERPGVARGTAHLSPGAESGHRRSDAPAQRRRSRRRSRETSELGRVRTLDARLVARPDRGATRVRRARWEVEVTAPTFADVQNAANQIRGVTHRTPVVTSRTVNERTGAEVFFKCENLQRGGAFKFRGAYNALSRLSPDERRRGVVTFSSGNHAQAIALAGQLLDIPSVIVMPSDAPSVKKA